MFFENKMKNDSIENRLEPETRKVSSTEMRRTMKIINISPILPKPQIGRVRIKMVYDLPVRTISKTRVR